MKLYHSRLGQVEITKVEDGKTSFIVEETGEEKTLVSKFVKFYQTEEAAEEAEEIRQELKEAEESEEREALRAEIEALEVEVQATIEKNGGLTVHEVSMRNIAKYL